MSVLNDRPEVNLEREVVSWCDSVYAEAEDELTSSDDFKLVSKCIDYIEGRQWGAKARYGRSRPVKNRLFRQFIETVGLLTDIQPDFQVTIRDHIDGYSELEKLLNLMITDWATMSDFEMELTQVVMFGLMHSGYAKIQWNSALNGGIGDVEFQPISPVNLMVVGATTKLQDAECVISRRVVNMAWLRRKYGSIVDGVRPDSSFSELPGMTIRPSKIPQGSWNRLPGPLKALLGTKSETVRSKYPQVMLKEYWFKDDCISPNTKILTADLRWINASEVKIGDELVGCDEDTITVNKTRDRWVRKVKVERSYKVVKPSVRIVTDRGTVECSESHRWLGSTVVRGKRKTFDWMFAGEMKVGDKIAFFGEPWEEDKSWDAGYLAGIFDGEGWVTKYQCGFGQAQHNAIVIEAVADLLRKKGFDYGVNTAKKMWRNQKSPTMTLQIKGGRNEQMRFIGSMRPQRLLEKSNVMWEGKQLRYKMNTAATILSIEKIGDIELMAIKTDKSTFIANGLVSHNSTWEGKESIYVGKPNTNWGYWVEPGMPLYPRGRVILQSGNKILEDTCNPYWDAKFPFVQYRPYRVPWKFNGLSMLQPQLALQNIINRINGGVMDTIQAAIEPSIMAPVGAFSQSNWDNLDPGAPGAKIRFNNNTPKVPEFRKPPELGSYVLPFEQGLEAEQDLTSGAAAMNQALQKKQVPGGDSIEKILSSRSTNIRFAGRSLQSFLTEAGTMVVARNLQFADTRHRIAKFGAEGITANDFEPIYGNTIPKGMKGEQFVSKVQFGIRKGSLLAIEKEDKIGVAFTLRKQGDMSRRGLYRVLDENVDVKKIEAELKEEAAEKIALAGAAGALAHKGKK